MGLRQKSHDSELSQAKSKRQAEISKSLVNSMICVYNPIKPSVETEVCA